MARQAQRAGRSIRQTLIAGIAGTMLVAVVLGTSSVGLVAHAIGDLETHAKTVQDVLRTDAALRESILSQETYAFDFALTRSDRPIEELAASQATERDLYAEMDRLAATDPEVLAHVAKIREGATAWRERWLDPFIQDVRSRPAGSPDSGQIATNEPLFAPVEEELGKLDATLDQRRTATLAEMDATVSGLAAVVVPMAIIGALGVGVLGLWLLRRISGPLRRLDRTAQGLVAGESVTFVPERLDEIGSLATVLERLRVDVDERYAAARTDAERAATYNQLAELTSFAQGEDDLVDAAVRTLRRLAPSPRGHVMLLNNSTNRLLVVASWGEDAPVPGSLADIDRIDRCPGIRRATAYVASDLADDMAVHCPVHAKPTGSVVCLPMTALGSIVGVIHLERPTRAPSMPTASRPPLGSRSRSRWPSRTRG